MSKPSTNGTSGRKSNGQFAEGNKCGTGNPYARRVARLRSALLDAVGENGLADIWRSWRRGGQAGGHRAAASAGDGKGEASID